MAKLEHDISRLSATLGRRRHRIERQKQALREDAMELCKQPRALVTAAVTGAVLERVLVDARTGQPSSAEGARARRRGGVASSIRTLFFGLVPALIRNAISPL